VRTDKPKIRFTTKPDMAVATSVVVTTSITMIPMLGSMSARVTKTPGRTAVTDREARAIKTAVPAPIARMATAARSAAARSAAGLRAKVPTARVSNLRELVVRDIREVRASQVVIRRQAAILATLRRVPMVRALAQRVKVVDTPDTAAVRRLRS